tara:strand:+ start:131 stop:376 length:246 start_codon:yes stop_codon:yes gene_type:complete
MNKANHTFTISLEVIEKLREVPNKSALVDSLLFKHFEAEKDPMVIKLELAKLNIMAKAQEEAESITMKQVAKMTDKQLGLS